MKYHLTSTLFVTATMFFSLPSSAQEPGPAEADAGVVRQSISARTETLTGTSRFDIPKEVASFVERTIKSDPDLQARYLQLIAAVKEEAGGRFSAGKFIAIEWLVPAYTSRRITAEGGGADTESVYLVQRQLISGYSRGYSVPENVVAQVTVNIHTKTRFVGRGDETQVSSRQLKLHFDGFVKVQLTLDKMAAAK